MNCNCEFGGDLLLPVCFISDCYCTCVFILPSTVVDCSALTNPPNGQISTTGGTTFGQNATYSCNTGYNLMGDNTRTCEATGNWSGSAPTCQSMFYVRLF